MPLKRPTTTPLPDEIYDEWAPQLGEAELKVLLYIVRRTLGFRKGADAISLNQFLRGIVTHDGRVLDHGCGVKSRANVVRALKGLEAKGLIRAIRMRTALGDSDITIYALHWEGDEYGPSLPEGGIGTKPGGGIGTTPRWFRSDRPVVSAQDHGDAAAKPTTNSISTNSQQDSCTTGITPHTESEHGWSVTKDASQRDQALSAEPDGVWRMVLAQVRSTMTSANYDRWFAATAGVLLEGNDLTVIVPTEMHRYWLDVRLRHRLDDALRLLRYTDVRVNFIVAVNGNHASCPGPQPHMREEDDIRGKQLP